ncbi:phosphodiester glycosidase family protein [Virgibacillus siamensis]|uniref:phosphodiester glycosidase family protein n=1 Tax=Virgibacillus siamensis TaxID=480071 RepID=UPI00158A1804|nr:phosphodiester glycosidase family protein [Virgibacillus siamensis]
MNQKWWIRSVQMFVLAMVLFVPAMQADAAFNPASEVRSSSDRTEPEITVGPDGATIVSEKETTTIGPGIELTTFERFDSRGWINGEMMTVDLTNDKSSTDLLFPGEISKAKPVSEMAAAAGAIGGVNGDFFDINDTNAPLGTAIKDGKLLKGPQGTHTLTVGVDKHGIGHITDIFLDGTIHLPSGDYPLAAFNQYTVPEGGIGLYTPLWGKAQRSETGSDIYEVTVRNGNVIAVDNSAGKGEIREGTIVLTGRGQGADRLRNLTIGDSVTVEYAPKADDEAMMDFAVGGNAVLIENGQVQAGLDDTTTAPRTAVGLSRDGKKMILAAIDGRQVDSRGMTYKELAHFMKEQGAYTALNIDGGGSTTMVARKPGKADARVVNSPSDGEERNVPNGIGIFAKAGSGELTGFTVETVIDVENSNRVFPGLSRTFTGLGYDENYFPVAVNDISWQAIPANVGSFDKNGVFYAEKSGSAQARAKVKSVKGTAPLTVLGELDRIETTTAHLSLEMGSEDTFTVIGYDEAGYSAPIESRDIELDYDETVISIKENKHGGFKIVPKKDGSATLITIRVLDMEIKVPATVGFSSETVSDFEELTSWESAKYPFSVKASLEPASGKEGKGIKLNYDFTTTTATRAAYLQASPKLELPGDVQKIGLWVKGDGNGAWLRMVIEDASDTRYTLNLADEVNWTGWKYVETTLPDGIQYPVNLWRIYPVETNGDEQYTGQLIFDNLTVEVPPAVDMPEQSEEEPDSLIIQNGTIDSDRWKFAVLADSQFTAATPNGRAAKMARESLRQIVRENPDFLVINGDLVDTAWEEDFEFAKQLLEEEVGDSIPIYYIPGNHEIAGPGTLNNFLDVFEENRFTFDHEGTRFILLDSSTGSFRTSDFEQLPELKESLQGATTDPAINNVVVFSHHPTRDPLPTDNSQLQDSKEAALIEKWLTNFRKNSDGKGAIYISGHAHTVNVERVEGVPYMVVGPSGKAPYGAPDEGGFYAWTMFGVDATPVPDKANGPDQASDRSNVYGSEWIQAKVRPLLQSITLHAPDAVDVGETVTISATGHQHGNLEFPLEYPATVTWKGSGNLFIGKDSKLEQAKKSGKYAAVFDTASHTLEALSSGEISLVVESNDVQAEQKIELTNVN